MHFSASLREGLRSLAASRQRSVLALVGVVIGVSSVIAMLSVGAIVRQEAAKQFQELGTDILNIRIDDSLRGQQRGARALLSLDDALGLTTLATIEAAAPFLIFKGQAVIGGKKSLKVDMVGATDVFAVLNKLTIERGRFVSGLDGRRHHCVVGQEIANAIRSVSAGDVIGNSIRIGGAVYTVVGVLGRTKRGVRRFNPNRTVVVPMGTAHRVSRRSEIRDITARMNPLAHHVKATEEIRGYYRRKSEALVVRVESPEELIERREKQSRLFTLLLGVVGGIALLTGGIGIMNVMLMSVTERRMEIGLRRALGARRRDIQSQFLIESLILALFGGVFGIVLGIGTTYGICRFADWPHSISAMPIALGFCVAAGTGVFFGYFPAWQAAQLDPVAALRGR